jgi:hypothetical protein
VTANVHNGEGGYLGRDATVEQDPRNGPNWGPVSGAGAVGARGETHLLSRLAFIVLASAYAGDWRDISAGTGIVER